MKINADFMILCGGQGTRLRSVVGESQKVMATIGHEPFLDILVKWIQQQGGRRIILAMGYKSHDVQSYYQNRFKDLEFVFSSEDEPLGTGGAVKKASVFVHNEQVFILNGDSFCPIEFDACLNFHVLNQSQVTVVVSKVQDKNDYGSIVLDKTHCVQAFQEKTNLSTTLYVNAGIYCLNKSAFSLMPSQSKFSLERDFFPSIIGKNFFGFVTQASFFDIGTPERLEIARRHFMKDN